ncbi:MAG: BPSL0067 family protein [Burkholderiales bacterium]|nr:BPSL0067 family protein [Burkholderiales bacterium]
MSYRLRIAEKDVFGKDKFANDKGNTECVEFVRQATGAPPSATWRKGTLVSSARSGAITRGTAIATFDANGRYPTDALGRHAAIYLEHTAERIVVLDQWNAQGEVKQRSIWFNRPKGTRRSNDGDTFSVIE